MRLLTAALVICLCISCQTTTEHQSAHIPKSYTIDQFYKNKNVFGGSFSPDGKKLLVSTNESGIYNAKALPVDGSPGEVLTNSEEESVFAISYFPNDERILFSSDRGGDEIDHIFVRNTNGTIEDLTPGEEAKSNFYGWAKDLKGFYYGSNARDANFFDLYYMNIESFDSEILYENTEGLNVSTISDDKRYFILTKTITTSNNEMYLYDSRTKEQKHITPHEGDISYDPQYFSSDNSLLYYLSDEEGEYQTLYSYAVADGAKEKIHGMDWDIWYAYQSFNDKYRVIGANVDGKTEVKITDLASGKDVDFPDIDGRSISSVSISRDETQMRLTAASTKFPSDIYVYRFADGNVQRLTDNLNPDIVPEDLVSATVVRFPSFDGLEIPAIYYKPHQASPENKVPAMLWIHGGPGGQTRQSYFALLQYMVNQGYAVLAVNNRGSSGYGKTFFKMDDQKHGDVDLKDCIYGKKYLQTLDYIDHDKIGILGGSYGGYMVMAALTFAPEEFDVGVNIFGVTNWLRTMRSIPPWWESFREALYAELGDPNGPDSVRLYEISPLFHAENVTKPLMVLQGANDPRVLQVESDEIVEAVKANGVPVEYVLFEDEGHGFVKKENEIEGYGQIVAFLDKHLKGEDVVPD